ncbi:CoB--CoM heterodisulfide reductase iron-sulfur subunit B family protein [Candidatus Desantisbacteria bacterium]|nr:CoB--CoM heterodisulfide reductase iron-sulfur subunit B family protein [Candidatus Desantisbacteria bacterium]
MEYSYYPGCSLHGMSSDYDKSVKSVAMNLDIKLKELKEWVCCGARPAHIPDQMMNLAIPALDLAEAGKLGLDLVTVCAACYNRLKTTNMFLEKDNDKKKEIEGLVEGKINSGLKIHHFLEILTNDIEIDLLKSRIKRPLKELKVACYYGCLLTRPEGMLEGEKIEDPEMMDLLMEALGAKSLAWPYKTECCGTGFSISKTEIVLNLTGKILKAAKRIGAECIVVACPLCHANLDMRQKEIEKHLKEKFNMPIFYFTELAAIAMGEDYKNLGLNEHFVDPFPLLEKKNIMQE